jgi:DNA-binding NarL/FixJ family response regulator
MGYVVKSRLATDLLAALREVLAGRSFVSPSIASA